MALRNDISIIHRLGRLRALLQKLSVWSVVIYVPHLELELVDPSLTLAVAGRNGIALELIPLCPAISATLRDDKLEVLLVPLTGG